VTSRVWLHIGLPKTGTTYLQTVMWANRDAMGDQGFVLPGRDRRDHLLATRYWCDQPRSQAHTRQWTGAWNRIADDVASWTGDVVLTHEFFSAASADQAKQIIEALAPAEVHLVVTAREPVSLFASSWQESLKNRHALSFAEYSAAPVSQNTIAIWNWRSLDVRLVLERWAPTLPPERVHVLALPSRDAPASLLWERFSGVIGLDGAAFELGDARKNASLGAVEAQTLLRINRQLHPESFKSAFDRGVYIRSLLADRHLGARDGERFWPDEHTVEVCRTRAAAAVRAIAEAGYDVVGDLDDLVPPVELDVRRSVESVTDAEVADVATALAGDLLLEIRSLTAERNRLRAEVRRVRANPSLRVALSRRYPRLGRILR
jgi:hypothetical protein